MGYSKLQNSDGLLRSKGCFNFRNHKHYLIYCVLTFLCIYLIKIWPMEKACKDPDREEIKSAIIPAQLEKQNIENEGGLRSNDLMVDAVDGVGYKFKKSKKREFDARYHIINYYDECDMTEKSDPIVNDLSILWNEFYNCINPIVQKWKGEYKRMNVEWVSGTVQCDKVPSYETLDISGFDNQHETKWTILPKCRSNNTMLTLGVGHDTDAEEKLSVTLPNTKFYGVDPIIEPNIHLYSAFGKFFPFAVGRKAGMTKFKVLPNQNQKTRKYVWQDVTTVDIIYFLKNIVNLQRIDIAWIDIEGGEFEFLDYFHKGEEFDQNNISICQFNVEIHSQFNSAGEKIFHDFIFRVLEEKRYIFLKPMKTAKQVHRMFFINIENTECVRKFIK